MFLRFLLLLWHRLLSPCVLLLLLCVVLLLTCVLPLLSCVRHLLPCVFPLAQLCSPNPILATSLSSIWSFRLLRYLFSWGARSDYFFFDSVPNLLSYLLDVRPSCLHNIVPSLRSRI